MIGFISILREPVRVSNTDSAKAGILCPQTRSEDPPCSVEIRLKVQCRTHDGREQPVEMTLRQVRASVPESVGPFQLLGDGDATGIQNSRLIDPQ